MLAAVPRAGGDPHRGLHVDDDGVTIGIAAGSAAAGALVESASPGIAMLALGAGAVVAGLLVRTASTGPLRAAVPATA